MIAKARAGSSDIDEALKAPDPEPGLTRAEVHGIGPKLGLRRERGSNALPHQLAFCGSAKRDGIAR
jgi:hypothetical protein